jgi:hypothetical protein
MKQIRVGVFETNSSSTHSLTIVSEEDYEKWKLGEFLLDTYKDVLVPFPKDYVKVEDEEFEDDDGDLKTYEMRCEKENFTQHFTTKSGDKIVAFGNYGYDG